MATTTTETNNKGFGWGRIVRTATMPGVVPRVRELFGDGFAYFAFFIALVYRSVGLLPATHAYIAPANIGRFGIRHVIGEAANNIVLRRENIDQVIVFFAIIAAMLLIVLQFFYVLVALSIPTATAAVGFSDLFVTQYPSQDLAFIFMDRVFGVPGIFNSCVATSADCLGTGPEMNFGRSTSSGENVLPSQSPQIPWAFHDAMHELFRFYSIALLVVAVMLFLYFIVAIVAETAQTGTPFGKRFNSVWAPIRMVVALGLLIPLGHGLNGAQYITLYSAKLGSSLATNGWITFNETANEAMLGQGRKMIAQPNAPREDVEELVTFMYFAKMCKHIEENNFPVSNPNKMQEPTVDVDAYIVQQSFRASTNAVPLTNADFKKARGKSVNRSITVNIGRKISGKYDKYLGNVKPICGQLNMQLPSPSDSGEGAHYIQKGYFRILQKLWQDEAIDLHAKRTVLDTGKNPRTVGALITDVTNDIIDGSAKGASPGGGGGGTAYQGLANEYDDSGNLVKKGLIAKGIEKQLEAEYGAGDGSGSGNIPEELIKRGWGAAGVWYNRIADMNGKILASARNVPEPKRLPATMAAVRDQRAKSDESRAAGNPFSPQKSGQYAVNLPREGEAWAAREYSNTYDSIRNQLGEDNDSDYFSSIINFIFGTEGLMNIRDNRGVHPLAQLSGVGRSLIEATVRNLGIGLGSAAGGAAISKIPIARKLSGGAGNAGAFFFTVSSIGLTAGFLLFYIIPFLPFIYFFFAVSKWVKGIFEAMVGAPLWALAHIRIDGQGLPGDAARSGYELMLEIFLRPILIVFGLLAGLSVFSAQVIILNDIFDLVTMNVTGFNSEEVAKNMKNNVPGAKALVENARGPIDQLFFTVMYAIIIYLMATPSFKLVDQLPNNILRWMGSSVSSFADQQDDPASNLNQYAAVAGAQIFSQGTGAMANVSKNISK